MKYDFDSFIDRRNIGAIKWADIDNLKIDDRSLMTASFANPGVKRILIIQLKAVLINLSALLLLDIRCSG